MKSKHDEMMWVVVLGSLPWRAIAIGLVLVAAVIAGAVTA